MGVEGSRQEVIGEGLCISLVIRLPRYHTMHACKRRTTKMKNTNENGLDLDYNILGPYVSMQTVELIIYYRYRFNKINKIFVVCNTFCRRKKKTKQNRKQCGYHQHYENFLIRYLTYKHCVISYLVSNGGMPTLVVARTA